MTFTRKLLTLTSEDSNLLSRTEDDDDLLTPPIFTICSLTGDYGMARMTWQCSSRIKRSLCKTTSAENHKLHLHLLGRGRKTAKVARKTAITSKEDDLHSTSSSCLLTGDYWQERP